MSDLPSGGGLTVTRVDRVVTVCFDGTRGNALDPARYAGVRRAAEAVAADEILVIRGEGRHFCVGQDLAALHAARVTGRLEQEVLDGAAAVLAILRCRGPVVVAAQGAAVGAGALIVAAADVVVLAEDAWLGLPELELGLPLGGAVARRLLPAPFVRRMMLTGIRATADDIGAAGGATVVGLTELASEADRLAGRITGLDRPALLDARQLWGDREGAARSYEFEVQAAVAAMSSAVDPS